MFCSKCGKEINDNVKFCPNCGNTIGENVVSTVPINSNISSNEIFIKGYRCAEDTAYYAFTYFLPQASISFCLPGHSSLSPTACSYLFSLPFSVGIFILFLLSFLLK